MNNNSVNMNLSHGFESAPLAYSDSQPTNQNSYNSQTNPILIFGIEELKIIDINNIKLYLYWITDFIKNCSLKKNRKEDILCLKSFKQATYLLVSAMFESS